MEVAHPVSFSPSAIPSRICSRTAVMLCLLQPCICMVECVFNTIPALQHFPASSGQPPQTVQQPQQGLGSPDRDPTNALGLQRFGPSRQTTTQLQHAIRSPAYTLAYPRHSSCNRQGSSVSVHVADRSPFLSLQPSHLSSPPRCCLGLSRTKGWTRDKEQSHRDLVRIVGTNLSAFELSASSDAGDRCSRAEGCRYWGPANLYPSIPSRSS